MERTKALTEALTQKREAILTLWCERTLNTYTSPGFFKKAKDPFANPVGVNINTALHSIYDLLLSNAEPEAYLKPVDTITRIRAVQEFTPGQAVAPFLELKWVVRQILRSDRKTAPLVTELDIFDCDVDRIALTAFDVYTECREQVYRGRIRELKSGSYLLTDSACPSAVLKEELKTEPKRQ
ncbi:MAG: hypothetical protein CSA33_00480 [Desulfobulbus propionicus]|nr:MAG: hypothetical protein CSA33_00480 [Desulfobulbus propionicus]